jgi:hypothetical protein
MSAAARVVIRDGPGRGDHAIELREVSRATT